MTPGHGDTFMVSEIAKIVLDDLNADWPPSRRLSNRACKIA